MQTLIRPAIQFFLWFILLFGVLSALTFVPGIGCACNQLYRLPTEPVLKKLLSKAYVQMKPDGEYCETLHMNFASKAVVAKQMEDAKKTGQTMATIQGVDNSVNFHNLFLSFFIFYLVLLLRSPVGWKEKIRSGIIGTLLYYVYTVIKLYLILLIFCNQSDIGIYQTDAATLNLVKNIRYCMTLGANGLIVLLIWAVLVLKKSNWMQLLSGKEGAASKAA